MTTLAYVLYGFGLFTVGIGLIPFMAVLLVLGWALALVAISAVLRFGEGAQVIAWSLVFVFQPIAGVFYPVSVLPEVLQWIATAVPATHVFEGMRAVLGARPFRGTRSGSRSGLDVVYVGVALLALLRDAPARAVQRAVVPLRRVKRDADGGRRPWLA